MAAKIEPLLTIEDLDACPEDGNRYELIGGELFVSRAPRIEHQFIIQNIERALLSYLDQTSIGFIVPGAGIIFGENDAVIPDLVFVRRERWRNIEREGKFTGPPDLVAEVLSAGTENLRRDRLVKRQLYSVRGVKEYWIADSENRSLEVYRQSGQSLVLVATLIDEDELTSPLLPGFRIRVSSLFSYPPGNK